MTASNFVRTGGVGAVVTGLVYMVFILFNSQAAVLDTSLLLGSWGAVVFVVALVGQVVGITGIHVLQNGRYGRLGTAGYVVAFAGFAIELIFALVAGLLGDVGTLIVVLLFILGVIATFIGLVLMGVATLRARLLPSWFGVLLIAGLPVAAILGGTLGALAWWVTYAVFWLLVGYVLLSSRSTEIQSPAHAR